MQSLLEALLKETPDSTVYRSDIALLCLNRGADLIRLDRIPEACPVVERGIEVAERLEQEFPGDPEYSAILVDLENNLDITRSPLGNSDPDQLARTLERARARSQRVRRSPSIRRIWPGASTITP